MTEPAELTDLARELGGNALKVGDRKRVGLHLGEDSVRLVQDLGDLVTSVGEGGLDDGALDAREVLCARDGELERRTGLRGDGESKGDERGGEHDD